MFANQVSAFDELMQLANNLTGQTKKKCCKLLTLVIIDESRANVVKYCDEFYFKCERVFFLLRFSDYEVNERSSRREAVQHADEGLVLRTFRRWRGSSENRSNTGKVGGLRNNVSLVIKYATANLFRT